MEKIISSSGNIYGCSRGNPVKSIENDVRNVMWHINKNFKLSTMITSKRNVFHGQRVLSYLFLKIQVLRICQKRMSSFKLLIIVWFGSLGECIYLFNFLSYLLHEKYPYSEFSGSCFPAFGLNTERFEMSLRIQSKCKKIQTRTLPIQTFFKQWLRMITIQKGLI